MARFFIDRPVFAWVIAILIMMAGGISIFRLPVEQYPRIAPPVVTITAKYSGASAQTLEDTVAQVIEQKLNGIDGLLYINSTSDAAGQVSIRLTFDPDTNPDVAQMQVQNKLQLATSSLPEEVTRQGITVTKVADSFLQMYAFVSSDDSMSAADLCDFVGSTILDPLSRVDGVGEVSLFGAPYAMRIWLNPSKLLSYSLTPSDVINAVKAQNKQVSLGEVGGKPIRDGQQMNVTIKAQKQLTSVPEFERILLRVNPDGSAVRLRDVARVELGQESYTSSARYNGKPAAGVGIKLASDANALNTSNAVAPISRTAWKWCRPTIPFRSSRFPSSRWSRPCLRPSCWCSRSSTCSSRTSGPQSSLRWRFPWFCSARSASWRRSGSASIR